MGSNKIYRTSFAVIAISGAFLLAGCSGTSDASTISSSTEVEESAAPPAAPSPEPTLEGSFYGGTAAVTDFNGYSLEIEYEIRFGPAAYQDISDEKPGFTTVKTSATTSIAIRNVTTGRNYEFTDAGLQIHLALAYPTGSPICSLTGLSTAEYCIVLLRTTNDFSRGLTPTRTTLAAGESVQLETYNPYYGLVPSRTSTDLAFPSVDEVIADEVGTALFTPSHFLVLGDGVLGAGCELRAGWGDKPSVLVSEPEYSDWCKQ